MGEAEASRPSSSENARLSSTAVVLVIGGLILLLVAIASKQWLEARSMYGHYSDEPAAVGLFASAASSGARWLAVIFFAATALLALLGLVVRGLLAPAVGVAIMAAATVSWWIFDESEWNAGRAYTLGMFALLVLIAGLAQAATATRSVRSSNRGEFVDGQKHGRWYVYNDRGQCIAMEDWQHGTLVSSLPQAAR